MLVLGSLLGVKRGTLTTNRKRYKKILSAATAAIIKFGGRNIDSRVKQSSKQLKRTNFLLSRRLLKHLGYFKLS